LAFQIALAINVIQELPNIGKLFPRGPRHLIYVGGS